MSTATWPHALKTGTDKNREKLKTNHISGTEVSKVDLHYENAKGKTLTQFKVLRVVMSMLAATSMLFSLEYG